MHGSLERLTAVNYGDAHWQDYAFDAMGNRLSLAVDGGTPVPSTYNEANMLLTRGAATYTNDDNGNQLTGGGRANTWDSQNRLRTCVTAQHTSAFTYAADGLRRQTVLDGQATTQYILDSSMVIRDNTAGGVNAGQVTYLCGPRGPEYRRTGLGQNAQVTWYCYDGLGSVLAEVSSTGYITGARQMDVYGAPRATQGAPTSKQAFVGALGHPTEDDTGLIYMRARWMDPVTGTFVSEDPARQGENWFGYCGGSPVTRADRTGRTWEEWTSNQLASFGTYLQAAGIAIMGYGAHLVGVGRARIAQGQMWQMEVWATGSEITNQLANCMRAAGMVMQAVGGQIVALGVTRILTGAAVLAAGNVLLYCGSDMADIALEYLRARL